MRHMPEMQAGATAGPVLHTASRPPPPLLPLPPPLLLLAVLDGLACRLFPVAILLPSPIVSLPATCKPAVLQQPPAVVATPPAHMPALAAGGRSSCWCHRPPLLVLLAPRPPLLLPLTAAPGHCWPPAPPSCCSCSSQEPVLCGRGAAGPGGTHGMGGAWATRLAGRPCSASRQRCCPWRRSPLHPTTPPPRPAPPRGHRTPHPDSPPAEA